MGEGDSSGGEEDSDSDSDSDSGRNPNGLRANGFSSSDYFESSMDEEDASSVSASTGVYSSLIAVCDTKIDIPGIPSIRPAEFLRTTVHDGSVVNVNHDYRYMKLGYYVSLHAELTGNHVLPKCSDALDVYRSPILLLRASKVRIPIMPYLVTDSSTDAISRFDLPLIVFPLKPFPTCGFNIVYSKNGLDIVMKRLTMNKRYTACIQPLRGQLASFKSVFGTAIPIDANVNGEEKVWDLAKKLYDEFKIPLFKFFVQRDGKQVYLSGIDPLKKTNDNDLVESKLITDKLVEMREELV